jgi:hypothetical protein
VIFIAVVLTSITLVGFVVVKTHVPEPQDELLDIARLKRVLPILAEYKVRWFQKQSWCDRIDYARGRFSRHQTATCERDQPFDAQAEHDFQTVADVLASSNVPLTRTYAEFDDIGKVQYAEFHLPCRWCRVRYVYSPYPGGLRMPVPGELWHRQLNEEWWVTDEDWN